MIPPGARASAAPLSNPWKIMGKLLPAHKSATKANALGRITFDTNFLGKKLSRKLYLGTHPDFLVKSPLHRHDSAHQLVCSEGDRVFIGLLDESGNETIVKMEPATTYFVPAKVPHQILIRGVAVLESYSTTAAFNHALSALAKEELFIEVIGRDLFPEVKI